MKKIQIGVIGPALNEYPKDAEKREALDKIAEDLGRLIAKEGAILLTGGTDGVMEAASRGAKRENGIIVGIPGRQRGLSNKYVDVEILTDIDVGSFIVAGLLGCDAVIAVPGGAGTLAELCIAYRLEKPVIVMKGFDKFYDAITENYLDESKAIRFYGEYSDKNSREQIRNRK